VHAATRHVCERLRAAGVRHLAFFTGGKGFRVLIVDDRLWRRVRFGDKYGPAFVQGAAPEYLGGVLGCHMRMVSPCLDASTHDREKGIKPDVHAHFVTGLWPAQMDAADVTREDPQLSRDIAGFWQEIVASIPEDAAAVPRLGGPMPAAPRRPRPAAAAAAAAPPRSAAEPLPEDAVCRAMFGTFLSRKDTNGDVVLYNLRSHACPRAGRVHSSNHT